MKKRDPRVDAYIARSAEFAQPILVRLRDIVHEVCPGAEETLKWSSPTFMYEGEMLCGMAAFKKHCVFGFWKHSLVVGEDEREDGAMGQFGRLTRLSDLPAKRTLVGYIKKAMRLNEEGITVKRAKPAPKKPLVVPKDLVAALRGNRRAAATFEGFSPSHRREYVEWITEAKTEVTRERRLGTTIEWLAEGKSRNWKYEKR